MIKIIDISNAKTEDILTRDIKLESGVEEIVAGIIENVRKNGDSALLDYAEKFDGARPENLVVSDEEIEEAFASVPQALIETIEEAKENIWEYHKHQVRDDFEINKGNGIILGQKITPIEKAGVYVPGGTASYPSTVLMDVIPAKIAGVKEIVMTTPCGKNGKIAPAILAAAKIAGVTKIIKSGGAQAVAALAYGTESVPKVDKIVGPGNVFVATAKRMVFGMVDIDMIAGPSEILVLADNTCRAKDVAADLLSQAEHDKLASAVLVTDSEEFANEVSAEIERQLPLLERAEIARASIDTNGKIIVAESIESGIEIANIIAPEHLEVCVDKPFELLGKIKHAGSIFLGKNTPEALGDYLAGPNHTLPTSGTARFSSALSVDDFVKKSQYLYYEKEALEKVKDKVVLFAETEGLTAHAQSAAIRFED
ncbi:MAG: histidinol dehydrogenase [Clostridia bacterium]|nr:histidinol dehydrogenase [Clostridia bacterium]